MKKLLVLLSTFLIFTSSFSNYWQPYPINYTISSFGTLSRLELSVWDSVLGSWQYYNSPYFSSNIDTSYGSSEIIALKTYFPPNLYDRDSIYGYITYDPVLHQFMPVIKGNSDPDAPGASVFVNDNVVGVFRECCVFNSSWGNYYDQWAEAYTYDINQHEWRGGVIKSGSAWDQASVDLGIGTAGYLSYSYNDDEWNPNEGIKFYTPSLGIFGGASFYDSVNGMSGNQDQLYCIFQQFVYNDISSIRIYNPPTGYFPGFLRSTPGIDVMNGGMTYQSYPDSNWQYFTMFDDFSNEMKIVTNIVCEGPVQRLVGATIFSRGTVWFHYFRNPISHGIILKL